MKEKREPLWLYLLIALIIIAAFVFFGFIFRGY